jgi:hypothetical protein
VKIHAIRTRLTHERIRAYAAANPTAYWSHDPETAARLAERQLVHPTAVRVAA